VKECTSVTDVIVCKGDKNGNIGWLTCSDG